MAKSEAKTVGIVDTEEALTAKIAEVRAAQAIFATYTQEQVDKIFKAAAIAANKARIPLAKMAVEETGMGIVEDKVIKNNYAAEHIYNKYKNVQTCGVFEENKAYGTMRIYEPIGLIAAVIPTTNPTSTAIFKTLICLKTDKCLEYSSRSWVCCWDNSSDKTDRLVNSHCAVSLIFLKNTTSLNILVLIVDVLSSIVVLDNLVFNDTHACFLNSHLCKWDSCLVSSDSSSLENLIYLLLCVGSEDSLCSSYFSDLSSQSFLCIDDADCFSFTLCHKINLQ